MTTVTFDTLELVDKLKSAGIPQAQAEAVVRVISEAQESLITRDHLDSRLDRATAPIHTDLAVLKWMMGAVLAGVLSLVLKAFF
ncbi:MAG: CCDC90 family protein [Methylobacter sp.]|uniref:DUF1640 domain-containing protein n=1 Tax=Methylobacter sp. TaxID=2051955 RepID=UPI00258C42C9|nr:DUF1640 domain-containing protein [Methylobacter sp.]MCL7419489.1 CCDC90 family protein [Methylobacter sp.]